jgi:phosphate transport system permease protein
VTSSNQRTASPLRSGQRTDRRLLAAFRTTALLSIVLPLGLVGVLLVAALSEARPRLGWSFLTSMPSRWPEVAGILPALAGSTCLLVLTAVMAIPLGLGAAIYLEEYARPGRLTALIEANITHLAGIPSIIYGLLGLEVFVRAMHLGRSLVAGAATLALLLLPVVITTAREALRAVPRELRESSFALGADRWQTLRRVVLPNCWPRVVTGLILSLSRAIGEAAPLIALGSLGYVAFVPKSLGSSFTALPLQIFGWISRPQTAFHANAAAGIVVLLALVLVLNLAAIWLRQRWERRQS